jgi:hypothetical protein
MTTRSGEGIWADLDHGWIRSLLYVIGPDFRDGRAKSPSQPVDSGWCAALAVIVAIGLLLMAAGQGAGLRSDPSAARLFWSGIVIVVLPTGLRIAWPPIARSERLFLLVLLAEGLFFLKISYSPTGFVGHDEFLHWIAADDILTAKQLFLSNPLLPIGAIYPALEILTTAIVNLTGLSLYAAAMLLLVVLKGTFITAMFLFFERLLDSARMAAVACLVYMGCSSYVLFDSMFSYESLGIVFCALIFATEAKLRDRADDAGNKRLVLIVLLLAGLAVTHHLSAAYAAIYLCGVAILEVGRRGASLRDICTAAGLAAFAVALPVLWLQAWGNPLIGYLGPVVEFGFDSLLHMFGGHAAANTMVESNSVPTEAIVMRLITLCGILLLSIGCATGFFRTLAMAAPADAPPGWPRIGAVLRRRWRDSRLVLVAFLAFAFPVSVVLRLGIGSWEIGNRMGTLAFVGAGPVVAVAIVRFWQGQMPQGWNRLGPAIALVVIVLGGVTAATIDPIRGPYRAGGDAESIEPMAIETAVWAKKWLGPGRRFVADRVNRLLLGGYGRQDVQVEIVKGVAAGSVYQSEKLSQDDLYALSRSNLDFMLVDMRLSTAPPLLGFYFESWEPNLGEPISPVALLKFDKIPGIGRVYDNGAIKIYDVRGLHER